MGVVTLLLWAGFSCSSYAVAIGVLARRVQTRFEIEAVAGLSSLGRNEFRPVAAW